MASFTQPLAAGLQAGVVKTPNNNPKSRLNHLVQRLVGRPVTKNDVAYNVEIAAESPGVSYRCTVAIDAIGLSIAGDATSTRKEAECSAADAALGNLEVSGQMPLTSNLCVNGQNDHKTRKRPWDQVEFTQMEATDVFHEKKCRVAPSISRDGPAPPLPVGIVRGFGSGGGCGGAGIGGKGGCSIGDIIFEDAADGDNGWSGKGGAGGGGGEGRGGGGRVGQEEESGGGEGGGGWLGEEEESGGGEGTNLGAPMKPGLVSKGGSSILSKRHMVIPSPHFQKGTPIDPNCKGRLNQFLGKFLGRPLTKYDVKYEVSDLAGGFSARVDVPVLEVQFYGAVSATRKDAEQQAAMVALYGLQMGQAGKPTPRGVTTDKPTPVVMEMGQELEEWRDTRLEVASAEEIKTLDSTSLDLWYGQVCLLCQVIVSKCCWAVHVNGRNHTKRFEAMPLKKVAGVPRPPTAPSEEQQPDENFIKVAGWAPDWLRPEEAILAPSVLLVGEMDYSFSLSVAKLRPSGSIIVATSYLEEHDPSEPEVHPSDDGERAAYRRRTLPSMNGVLHANLDGLRLLGADIRHGVDATNLEGTLRSQGGFDNMQFDFVVFPFPRASLHRACDPRNSRLLRNFFRSVRDHGFLSVGGEVQLVMLSVQYEEWDVACMAADAGFVLKARAQLPPDFYQSREMSGKPWTPQGAELLCFEVESDVVKLSLDTTVL
eukprot:TRINITY_DN14387_c0_g1_i1.p1 TRINITY_DN14387_c0_g1~~TRINITY_DN14387_c0_g1_i1.p1  ORF type:complete len:709 (-),score=116.02 TRINITY_DN14387_c0_g1_i1:168-2294(-)